MAFRMKVEGLFRIGEKTVFTGELDTQSKAIVDVPCVIEIDGEPAGEIRIEGEVHTGRPHRDLWTTSQMSLTREVIRDHDVWLISQRVGRIEPKA
jgi:hypothetical protein